MAKLGRETEALQKFLSTKSNIQNEIKLMVSNIDFFYTQMMKADTELTKGQARIPATKGKSNNSVETQTSLGHCQN